MAGEISPDIMFCNIRPKVSRMGAEGCRWVRMGSDGCMGVEDRKNKVNRGVNSRERHVLQCMCTACILQQVDMHGHGDQRASRAGINGK